MNYKNILFLLFLFVFQFSLSQNNDQAFAIQKQLDSLEILIDLDQLDRPISELKGVLQDAYTLNDSVLISHAILLQSALNMYLSDDVLFRKNLSKAATYFNNNTPDSQRVYYYNLEGIKHSLDGNKEKGLQSTLKSLEYAKNANLERQQLDLNFNIALDSYVLGKYDICKNAVNEAIRIAKKFNLNSRLYSMYYRGAILALKEKDLDLAETYLNLSETLFNENKNNEETQFSEELRIRFFHAFGELYEIKGDYKLATKYFKKYIHYQRLENQKKREYLAQKIKFDKDVELKNKQFEKIQAETKLKEKQLEFNKMLSIFIFLAFLACLVFIYYQHKHSKAKTKINKLLKESNNELNDAKIKIEQLYESKISILNNLSHELKTPLHSINGLTEIIKLERDNRSSELKNIKLLQKNAELLFHFIEDAIYNNKKSDKISLSLYNEQFNLKAFIFNTIEFSKQQNGFNFPVVVTINPEVPKKVCLDKIKLRQIIDYFLNCAFIHANSINDKIELTIAYSELNHVLSIKITDQSNQYQNMKSIIANLDTSSNKYYGDIDFGLVLAQRFIKIYNGSIRYNYEEKIGSSVQITLHISTDDSQVIKVAELISHKHKLSSSPRILIVEDNKVSRTITKKIIESEGYNIELAENGKDAINKVKTQPYDIIFMDIMMPEMDGFEASKIIKTICPDVIIVALSAITSLNNKNEFFNSGISKFIRKPSIKDDLIKAIEELYIRKE